MTPEGARTRCHLWIRGAVQGVGFRFFTEREARRLRVAGFVRNLPDGRVEVVAEGPPAAVDALVAALRRGPAGARVEAIETRWEPPAGLADFRIVL